MVTNKNPFVELYVTEFISADKFVKIFSPVLVEESETHALFQPGNVMLTGLQGSGKTALLNLLKPEVFLAYARNKEVDWPLPKHCSKFISAGINLAKSSAMDFGQRSISDVNVSDSNIIALFFADFLNYWIVDDLLLTLETLCDAKENTVKQLLGLNFDKSKLDEFAKYVASQKCWFGALDEVSTYAGLRSEFENRITEYRSFLNHNSELSTKIQQSKTSPGEPIGVLAAALKHFEIIPHDLPVFIRIDQFEDLMGLEKEAQGAYSKQFRSIVMKMLGTRDDRVSYRIGARPYSFYPDFMMFGTSSAIEEMRNYKVVDIGSILRGHEARRSLFPKFCNDVFTRRLNNADFKKQNTQKSAINRIFGSRTKPEEKAKIYTKNHPLLIAESLNNWPENSNDFLSNLAKTSPLSAKLGEAWLSQRIARDETVTPENFMSKPWETESQKWWKKERIQQALLQISSSRRQRMIWFGGDDIVALSGRNILVFLSLCQFTFAEHLRSSESIEFDENLEIKPLVQDMGIQEASAYWFRKVKAEPNGGDDRNRFVNVLGTFLRHKLRDDKRMSYPGANGFSLSISDLEKHPHLAHFLELCGAYGTLETFRHTPKTKSKGQSQKWYLSSILTPYFQVPTPHTKEPYYARAVEIYDLMRKADIVVNNSEPISNNKQDYNEGTIDLFSSDRNFD